jgi:hypothetical protein
MDELNELIVRLKARVIDVERQRQIAFHEAMVARSAKHLAEAEASGEEEEILHARLAHLTNESLQAMFLLEMAEQERREKQG